MTSPPYRCTELPPTSIPSWPYPSRRSVSWEHKHQQFLKGLQEKPNTRSTRLD